MAKRCFPSTVLLPLLLLSSSFDGSSRAQEWDAEAIVRTNKNAVLYITGTRRQTGAPVQGSGCSIDTRGFVLATVHQIRGVDDLRGRFPDGTEGALHVLDYVAPGDFALLQFRGAVPAAISLGDATGLKNGAHLISIASPRGLEFTVLHGIVSATNRTYRGLPVVQCSLPAGPGSSGGPVFDTSGRLVGLIMGRITNIQGVTLMSPIQNAFPLFEKHGIALPSHGHLAKAARIPLELTEDVIAPSASLTDREARAIQAYNQGAEAHSLRDKINAYKVAVKLLPNFYEGWYNLGVVLGINADFEDALQAFARAQKLRPDSKAPPRNMGRIYLELDHPDEAVASFKRVADLAPKQPASYNDLGEAYRRMKLYTQAAASFEKALTLDSDYASAQYNLGLALANAERNDEAAKQLQRYLQNNPEAPDRHQVEQWVQHLRKNTRQGRN